MQPTCQQYQPLKLPTYAERKREKERQLAIAAGRVDCGEVDVSGFRGTVQRTQEHDEREMEGWYGGEGYRNSGVPGETTQFTSTHSAHAPPSSSTVPPRPFVAQTENNSHRRPLPTPSRIPPAEHISYSAAPTPSPDTHHPAVSHPLRHFASQASLVSSLPSRDRQRTLPSPTSGALRTVPSLPYIQQSPVNQREPPPIRRNGSPFHLTQPSEHNSMARQASTPNLVGNRSRPLPTPLKALSARLETVPEPSPSLTAPSTSVSASPYSAPISNSDYGPSWSSSPRPDQPPAVPVMDRSDTLSSIKSLDRWELSQRNQARQLPDRPPSTLPAGRGGRPLPPPPVSKAGRALASSRSLDRGIPHRSGLMGLTKESAVGGAGVDGAGERPEASGGSALPSSVTPITTISVAQNPPARQAGATSASSLPELVRDPLERMMGDMGLGRENCKRGDGVNGAEDASTNQEGKEHQRRPALPLAESRSRTSSSNPAIAIPTITCPDAANEQEGGSVCPLTVPSLPSPQIAIEPPSIAITPFQHADVGDVAMITQNALAAGGNSIPTISFSEPFASESEQHPSAPRTTSVAASTPPRTGIFCSACELVILGSIINAAGKRWHPDCLRCTTCQVGLEHVSRYEHDGKPYCHMDYHEQFAPKCHHCNTPIIDQRYITIDDTALGKRFYHELHFFCGECGIPFLDPSRSSSAGTEVRRGKDVKNGHQEEEDQTAAFVIHGRYAFCPECDIKLHRPKCKGCNMPIRDEEEAIEAMKIKWHTKCFKCASCCQPIRTKHFIPMKRKPYCQECYAAQT